MHSQSCLKHVNAQREGIDSVHLLGILKTAAIFTAQISALDFTISDGRILVIMAEIHYVLRRKLILVRHTKIVLFFMILPQHMAVVNTGFSGVPKFGFSGV